MEKNLENPLEELNRLKQQYQSFNQNLEGQKIIDDMEVSYTIKHCRNFFRSHCRTTLIDYPISIAIILTVLFLYKVSAIFAVAVAVLLLVGMFTELWIIKDLARQCQSDTLMKFTQRLFETKRILLIYYIVLTCSLLIIATIATAIADIPWVHWGLQCVPLLTVGVEMVYLFLAHYLPLRGQCNETLESIAGDCDTDKRFKRGVKFFGFVVLFFVVFTAAFKIFVLPGGTLLMLFTALLVIIFSIVWLRRYSFPPLLDIFLVLVVTIMVYWAMASVNCWPPMRPLYNVDHYFLKRESDSTIAEGRFSINQIYSATTDEWADASSILLSALSAMDVALLDADSRALLAVSTSDTAQVNALIHGSDTAFVADNSLIWAWSVPDREGKCQLYPLYKEPILGNLHQKPLLDIVGVECRNQTPFSLDLCLTHEAEWQWQANLVKLDNQPAPVTLAAVLDGMVLTLGIFDHENIGYQLIHFSLDTNTSWHKSIVRELINN
ncbi:MAG: hypothetical protein MJZ24_09075 [Paludibacteraceae bacterium]|nr:hypothetical protein [Paludibacteraceae bacterium]